MSLAKLLVLVLGLALVAFTVKLALEPTKGANDGVTAPARQLDNVRTRAREIERDLQKNADRADQP